LTEERKKNSVTVIIGCGPVALCAIACAKYHFGLEHVYAVDSVPQRLENAEKLGAIPLKIEDAKEIILEITEGRGADQVIEIVGNKSALGLAYDLIRPWGFLSICGYHQGDFAFSANQAYFKNLRIAIGRSPVRELFPICLEVLSKLAPKLEAAGMTGVIMPLDQAKEAYDLFNQQKVQKIIFKCNEE
jgi:threonine dehydrogenase-like Zn-dependent dehydrogenase